MSWATGTSAPGAAASGLGGAIAWQGEAPAEPMGGAACVVSGIICGDASNPAIIDGLATGSSLDAGLAGWSGVDRMDGADAVDRVDGGDLSSLDAGLAGWSGVDGMDAVDGVDGGDLSSLGAGLAVWSGGLAVGGAIAERTGAVAWVAVMSG